MFVLAGAALHVHDYAMGDIAKVIETMTYDVNCYFCIDRNGALHFKYFGSPPVHQGIDVSDFLIEF